MLLDIFEARAPRVPGTEGAIYWICRRYYYFTFARQIIYICIFHSETGSPLWSARDALKLMKFGMHIRNLHIRCFSFIWYGSCSNILDNFVPNRHSLQALLIWGPSILSPCFPIVLCSCLCDTNESYSHTTSTWQQESSDKHCLIDMNFKLCRLHFIGCMAISCICACPLASQSVI